MKLFEVPMLRRCSGPLLFCMTFFLLSALARGAVRVDTMLTMSDGVRLNVAYFIPPSPAPAAGHPALLVVHGFAGSKNDYAVRARLYADSGYFCVAYTVRGQGLGSSSAASEGEFEWFTGRRELEDARAIIDWIASRSYVNRERIGIEGISQGGLTTWGALIERMPVRCAVPIIGVPNYSGIMCVDGTTNYFTRLMLTLSGAFNQVLYAPWARDTLFPALEQDRYDDLARLIAARDLTGRIDGITVPVFMQFAWQDQIFDAALFFDAFGRLAGPKKIIGWPGDHDLPGGQIERERLAMTLRFYRRWLRDDEGTGVMDRDSAVGLIDPGTGATAWFPADDPAAYSLVPGAPPAGISYYFNEGLRLTHEPAGAPSIYPGVYVQNISNDAFVFAGEPLDVPFTMVGASASLVIASSGTNYQANVLLWDVDAAGTTRRPITRGACQIRLGSDDPPGRRNVAFMLSQQRYTIPAGHHIEAWIKYGTLITANPPPDGEFGRTPYPPQQTVVDTLFAGPDAPSSITLIRASEAVAAVAPYAPAAGGTLVIAGSPARRGAVLRVALPGGSGGRLEIIDARGALVRTEMADREMIAITTEDLPVGGYFLRLRRGASFWSGRFLVLE